MKTAIVIAGTVAALALAGCSSSSSETSASPTPAAETTAAAPAETMASPQASMVGPIIVEPDQTEVEATVGRFIDFNVGAKPGRWDIESDNPTVVAVTKGGKQGGAVMNPGGEALAVGTAVVTLTDTASDLDALQYTITVTE